MEPTIKTIEPISVLFVRKTGNYMKSSKEAWCVLGEFLKKHNLDTQKARALGIGHDDPAKTPEDQLRYDACITFKGDIQPEGEVGVQTIEGGTYAVFTHKGPYEKLDALYRTIFQDWLPTSGKTLRKVPMFEDYVVCHNEKDSEKWITDIYVPIEG